MVSDPTHPQFPSLASPRICIDIPPSIQRCVAGAVLLGLGLYVGKRIVAGWKDKRGGGGGITTFSHKVTVVQLASGDGDREIRPPGGAAQLRAIEGDDQRGDLLWRDRQRLLEQNSNSTEDEATFIRNEGTDAGPDDDPDPSSTRATSITPTANGNNRASTSGDDVIDEDTGNETDSDDDDDEWSFWRPNEDLVIWNSAQANLLPPTQPEINPPPSPDTIPDIEPQPPEVDERRWGRRRPSMDTIQEEEWAEEDSESSSDDSETHPRSPLPVSGSPSHSSASDSDGVYSALYSNTTTTRQQQRPLEERNDDVLADLQDDPDFRSLIGCEYEEEEDDDPDTVTEDPEMDDVTCWSDFRSLRDEGLAVEELEILSATYQQTPEPSLMVEDHAASVENRIATNCVRHRENSSHLITTLHVYTYAHKIAQDIIQEALMEKKKKENSEHPVALSPIYFGESAQWQEDAVALAENVAGLKTVDTVDADNIRETETVNKFRKDDDRLREDKYQMCDDQYPMSDDKYQMCDDHYQTFDQHQMYEDQYKIYEKQSEIKDNQIREDQYEMCEKPSETFGDKNKMCEYEFPISEGINKIFSDDAQMRGVNNQMRQSEIQMKEGEVQMKDGEIQMKEGETQMKEGEIQMKEGEIQMKEGEIQMKEGEVQMKEGEIQMKEDEIQMKESEIQMKEGEIQMIEGEMKTGQCEHQNQTCLDKTEISIVDIQSNDEVQTKEGVDNLADSTSEISNTEVAMEKNGMSENKKECGAIVQLNDDAGRSRDDDFQDLLDRVQTINGDSFKFNETAILSDDAVEKSEITQNKGTQTANTSIKKYQIIAGAAGRQRRHTTMPTTLGSLHHNLSSKKGTTNYRKLKNSDDTKERKFGNSKSNFTKREFQKARSNSSNKLKRQTKKFGVHSTELKVQSNKLDHSTQTQLEQLAEPIIPQHTEKIVKNILKNLALVCITAPPVRHSSSKSKLVVKALGLDERINRRRLRRQRSRRHSPKVDCSATKREVAYVTAVTRNSSVFGALLLGCSLRRVMAQDSRLPATVAILNNGLSDRARQLLANVYDHVFLTSELYSHDDLALQLLGRPELSATYVKLHCWRLTQYSKCVYLDADTLVLQNCDELFARDELSAVPDTGWPDCFNSGVFVFRPSLETYSRLVSLAATKGSFDGGDQGLLNTYFGVNWQTNLTRRLPFIYNVVSSLSYTYAPAYKHYASTVKIVHFLGPEKPWSIQWQSESGNTEEGSHLPVLRRWIQLFRNNVLPKLPQVARDAASTTPYVSVLHLLHQINVRRAESVKRGGDPLVQAYFPVQSADSQQSSQQKHQRSSSPTNQYHQDHHQYHQQQQHEHSQEEQQHRQQSSHDDNNYREHQESVAGSSNYNYNARSSHDHFASEHHQHQNDQQPSQQPVDPHWEALLWHAVQTPWEPPPPTSPDQFSWSAESEHQQQTQAEKTFGWFSGDTGARQPDTHPPEASQPASSVSGLCSHSETTDHQPSDQAEHESEIAPEIEPSIPQPETQEQSILRMKSWEEGHIDYLGQDRFDNIWKRIESMLQDEAEDDDGEVDERRDMSHPEMADLSVSDLSDTLSSGLFLTADRRSVDVSAASETASSVMAFDGAEATATEVESASADDDERSNYSEDVDFAGMYAWQEGNIDYCGRYGSDNIMQHLDQVISGGNKSRPS